MSIEQYSQILKVLCPSAVWNEQRLSLNEFILSIESVLEALHPHMSLDERLAWLQTHFHVDCGGVFRLVSEPTPQQQVRQLSSSPMKLRTTNLARVQAKEDSEIKRREKQRKRIAAINQLANPRDLFQKLDKQPANFAVEANPLKQTLAAVEKPVAETQPDQRVKGRRQTKCLKTAATDFAAVSAAVTVTHLHTDQQPERVKVKTSRIAPSSATPVDYDSMTLLCTICKKGEAELWCSPCFSVFCQACWSTIHGIGSSACKPIEKELDELDLNQTYTSYIRARTMSPLQLTTEGVTERLRRAAMPKSNTTSGSVRLGKPIIRDRGGPEALDFDSSNNPSLTLDTKPLLLDTGRTVDVAEVQDVFPLPMNHGSTVIYPDPLNRQKLNLKAVNFDSHTLPSHKQQR